MRKFITITIALLFTVICFSQDVFKYRSSAAYIRSKNDDGKYGEWIASDSGSGILIMMDLGKEKINIYGAKPREFNFINYTIDKKDESKGIETHIFKCVDNLNDSCYCYMVYYAKTKTDLLVFYPTYQMKFVLTRD